jgi:hypothetical protein
MDHNLLQAHIYLNKRDFFQFEILGLKNLLFDNSLYNN